MKKTLIKIALFSFVCKLSAQPIPVPQQTDPNISSPVATGNLVYPTNFISDMVLSNNAVTTANCSASSTAFTTKYSKFQTYIPYANTPIKTVKIALHFFQDANSGNMWQNNAFTATTYNSVFQWLNHRREFTDAPSWPIAGVPFIQDSRIRYEVTGIYFYQDNALNANVNGPGDITALRAAVNAQDPNRLNSFPIFFTGGSFCVAPGQCASAVQSGDNIIMFNNGSGGDGSGTIDHELGHAFGLYHTYAACCGAETFNTTDPEYLSDILEPSWRNYCNPPANTTCPHFGGWNWDPYDHVTNPHSTNNIMGGCLYMGYVSPMQMGRMHRGLSLHSKTMWKYAKEMTSESNYPLIVNSDETWDFGIQMYQDIVIKQGATLTIKCKVGMANNGRIIVERGARLIIDGGEVYPWGNNWQGIQVWGTSNQKQNIATTGLSPYQGIVKVINQGIIRNANVGIATTKQDAAGNIDWAGYFGGIIQCDNAKFINNWKSIEFSTYHNYITPTIRVANISYINRSLFETNALLNIVGSPYPDTHISLWAVEGVRLYGNVYQNISSPLPSIENRGNGIFTYDGSFFLDRYKVCSVYGINGCVAYSTNIQSKFSNLNYGVHSTEASPFASITANDNDFINCNRAVFISGTHNSKITNNRVDIAQGGNLLATQPYGIYSEVSTGYDISNNNITTTNATTFNNLATGVYFYQTGGFTNMLYRNSIDKLNVGTTVIGNNSGNAPGDGLQLRCNQYGQTSQNWMDVWLHDDQSPWGNVGTIDAIQGNSTNGANNRFSHNNSGPRDFYDEGNPIVTYFYNNEASQKTKPLYYSSQLQPFPNSGVLNFNSMCPANLNTNSGGISVGHVLGLIATNTNSINVLKAKIDGNNTVGLLTAINSRMSAGDLKNLIEQASPYLSDQVLIAYFSKQSTPNGHIKDIHDKNKPVSQSVWDVILNLNLPNGILKDIKEQQSIKNPSQRLLLESQIATLNQQKALAVDNQVKSMLNDTINGYSQDSIVMLLIADNRIRSKTRLLSYYVANEKLAEATNVLYDIKAANNGSLDNFSKLQELIVGLKQTSDKIFTIKTDAQIKNAIEAIANDKTDFAYAHAQALLSKVFGYKYYEYVKLPASANGMRLKQKTDNEDFETITKNMLIYPNPSNSNTNVICLLPEQFSSAELVVYDLMGKQLLKQTLSREKSSAVLNTQDLGAGIYFINLLIDNNLTEIQKFIKQ